MKTLLKINDVSKILNISIVSVRRQIKNGNLKAIKIGKSLRFDETDIEIYVKSLTQKGG